jgi:hypothetical protein
LRPFFAFFAVKDLAAEGAKGRLEAYTAFCPIPQNQPFVRSSKISISV